MKDFEKAKELFKDTINPALYFNSISAEIARVKLEEAISEHEIPLIFIIGEPGVGKSYMLHVMHHFFSEKILSVVLNRPFFDKREFFKILYQALGFEWENEVDLLSLEHFLIETYSGVPHVIFIDEAQLLNQTQLEMIRILSDTKAFQFVISMHKTEGLQVLRQKQWQSRNVIVIEYGNLEESEVLRYVQSVFFMHSLSDMAGLFTRNDIKFIYKYTQGNFRTVKKFLYTLMKLLGYAQQEGLTKYSKINQCLLTMSALEIGLIHDA